MTSLHALVRRLQERPSVRTRGHRTVLLTCVAGGLLVPTYFLGMADVSHFAWDFRAYYTAAEAALAGEPFVGVDTGLPGVSYVYPPVAVSLFLPGAAAGGWKLAFALQTAANVATALALAVLVVRTIDARGGALSPVDRLLVAGFCVASAPVMAVFGQGQVDMLIALALAGAFVALERGREGLAGCALAGAALVKVFPAVLGLWLVRRRAWRAVGAAVGTGVLGLAVGWAVFGLDAYRRYLGVLAGRSRVAEFAGTVSPNFFAMSLYRPLSQLFPTVDPSLYAPLSLLVVAPPVVLVARRDREFTDRLATYLVAIVATLLVSPASNALYVVYVYFPLLVLLYVGDSRWDRSLLLAGTVAMTFPIQPAHVATGLTALGVPDPIGAPLLLVARAALTVASLPLVGLLAVLVWCSLRAARRDDTASVAARPTHAD